MIGMTKAKIKVSNDSLGAKVSADFGEVTCHFNPESFSIQRQVNYAQHAIPGVDRPVLQYISGGAEVLSFSVLFDTYSAGVDSGSTSVIKSTALPDPVKDDVREYTKPLMKLTTVNEDLHTPNPVEFVWGSISFKGYIQSINQRFTMFNMFGTPVRAVVDLTLISNKKDDNLRNSPDRTKARTLKDGDRLYAYAYAEYGDCGEWRRIAEENGIDNPRKLEFGRDIVIPPIL